jgi:hypothetical protein
MRNEKSLRKKLKRKNVLKCPEDEEDTNSKEQALNNLNQAADEVVEITNALPEQLQDLADEKVDDAKNAAIGVVKKGAELADVASDAGTVVAVVGIAAAPFTGGSSLVLTGAGGALSTGADVSSTVLKGIKVLNGTGSSEDFAKQGLKTAIGVIGGKVLDKVGSTLTKVNSAGRNYNPANGQFISNNYATGVGMAVEAAKILIGLGF